VLDEVATMMKKSAALKFRIEGHTDNVGAKASNLTLSKGRAASVKTALVEGSTRRVSPATGWETPNRPRTTPRKTAVSRIGGWNLSNSRPMPTISIVAAFAIVASQALLPGGSAAYAQGSSKNFALPAGTTDVENIVSNVPNFQASLTEGGTVPSEAKSTCDNRADGSFKSTVGLNLAHYFAGGKSGLDQQVAAYQAMGGFLKMAVGEAHDKVEAEAQGRRPFVRKSAVTFETVGGASAGYFTVTYGCVQDANPASTVTYYTAHSTQDSNWLIVSIQMYAAGPDLARKYALEILQKVKALDYASLK